MITVTNQNHWLIEQARLNPYKNFVILENERFTYIDIYKRVKGFSNYLKKIGICERDLVAIVSEHSSNFIIEINACWLVGAIPIPLNNKLSSTDIYKIYKETHCKGIIIPSEKKFKKELQKFAGIKIIELNYIKNNNLTENFRFDKNSDCLIIPTSGSSGSAKYVQLTFSNLFESIISSDSFINHSIYDIWFASLPFYHIGGFSIIIRTICSGCSIIIPKNLEQQKIYSTLIIEKPTLISFVPIMMKRILDQDLKPWKKLRHILIGGSSVQESIINKSLNNLWPISLVYGSTETASMVSICSSENLVAHGLSAGKPLPGVNISIVKNVDLENNKDEIGTITIESKTVSKGYLNNINLKVLKDGKFCSNDLGKIDKNGNLHIYGRADKIVISGGENISLLEIERILSGKFNESIVVGIKDEKWGQSYVVITDSTEKNIDTDVKNYLVKELPRFKLPKEVIRIEKIPKNDMGKIQKAELQKKISFDLL